MKEFSPNEERINKEILDCVKRNEYLKVSDLALKAKVAPSSIIKFCKKMGYSGWCEMYYELVTKVNLENSLISPLSTELFEIDEVKEKVLEISKYLLDNKDKYFFISSLGDAESLDLYLLKRLWDLGFKAMLFDEELIKQEKFLNNSISIIINESGIVLLYVANLSKNLGFKVLSFTSNKSSPLALESNKTIELKSIKSNYEAYQSNFFTAKCLIFLELLLLELKNGSVKND